MTVGVIAECSHAKNHAVKMKMKAESSIKY